MNAADQIHSIQIKSVRHAVRALQCADVSQHDWHQGQIMCNILSDCPAQDPSGPLAPVVHCVMVDFSTATVNVTEEIHRSDDFGDCLVILLRCGFDGELVWKHFGERESWDRISLYLTIKGERRKAKAADPFQFVYT
jgi:hypothetical protein